MGEDCNRPYVVYTPSVLGMLTVLTVFGSDCNKIAKVFIQEETRHSGTQVTGLTYIYCDNYLQYRPVLSDPPGGP